jgi:hypothetical protein
MAGLPGGPEIPRGEHCSAYLQPGGPLGAQLGAGSGAYGVPVQKSAGTAAHLV